MKQFRKVNYEFREFKGIVLIGETIQDEQEIKNICMKDYLENLSKEIKIIKEED